MKVFEQTRIKLTALYLAIIMLITVSFSVGVYNILSREVERFARMQRNRIETRIFPLMMDRFHMVIIEDSEMITEAKTRIAFTLMVVDAVILVCSGLLGYFLAGRTLKPIKDMVDEQNRFISDASHEFKTPLTALKSSFEVFLRDRGAKIGEARELIKDGIKDVDNLSVLAASLLDLAQSEWPGQKSFFKTVDLDDVINKAVSTVKPLAQKKRIDIKSEKSGFKVFGDVDRLSQLFTILLDNAVKYSLDEGIVEVAAESADSQHIRVKVTDRGVGVSSTDLPHVFDRFYRSDTSRSKNKVDGYGLGLPIAKSIVESHGGKIRVESEPGVGTTVQVVLRIGE